MSKTNKAMSQMSNYFSFASEKVKENFITFVRDSNIELNDGDMRRISSVLESSVMQSFQAVSERMEKNLNTLLSD